MTKAIQIAVEAKKTAQFDTLLPFQDEIKTMGKEEYERLRANILKYGFSFAVHVWEHKGKRYIIDGHQRMFALKQMAEIEGYKIPPVPINLVKAKSFKEAKAKVLSGASVYGGIQNRALFNYMKEYNIPFEEINSTFKFQEIDYEAFSKEFLKVDAIKLDVEDFELDPDMRVSSEGVRQVVLFYDAKTHEKFLKIIDELTKLYKKANVSDVIMECLVEKFNSVSKK